ncbi:type II toxin-antitoxin system RelE/ParE family toxin [Desulfobacter sp.]
MANKMAEYRLSPKAVDDMEAIWLYSFTNWSAEQADRYIDDLTETFEFLAQNTKVGISCDYIRERYRRYPVKSHIIFYREAVYGIEVMRILHNRMLPTLHL